MQHGPPFSEALYTSRPTTASTAARPSHQPMHFQLPTFQPTLRSRSCTGRLPRRAHLATHHSALINHAVIQCVRVISPPGCCNDCPCLFLAGRRPFLYSVFALVIVTKRIRARWYALPTLGNLSRRALTAWSSLSKHCMPFCETDHQSTEPFPTGWLAHLLRTDADHWLHPCHFTNSLVLF